MIALAYGHVSEGNYSPEMSTIYRIERFGVHAVMGRPVLYEREIRAMNAALDVVYGYRDRAKAQSWEAWMASNTKLGNLLFKAQQLFENGIT